MKISLFLSYKDHSSPALFTYCSTKLAHPTFSTTPSPILVSTLCFTLSLESMVLVHPLFCFFLIPFNKIAHAQAEK